MSITTKGEVSRPVDFVGIDSIMVSGYYKLPQLANFILLGFTFAILAPLTRLRRFGTPLDPSGKPARHFNWVRLAKL
jgi:hypothetical protein